TILLVAALTAEAGIEVIARMFALINSTMVLFAILVLLLTVRDYDFANMMPMMPHRIRPVLLGAYTTYGFPYAELLLFGILIPYVRAEQRNRVPAALYRALAFNIVLLVAVTACALLIFGPMAGERKYSLFEVARTIEVQEILQ